MSSKPLIVVVGADGFVGRFLAEALQAKRVVYGPLQNGDVHISHADDLLRRADVVINAAGFRVRPGCAYADYQRSHQGATAALVPLIRQGALLVHISSASVLGKSKDRSLGSNAAPNPSTFPSPAYATAKLEADEYLKQEAKNRGFRLIFLRPAVVYSLQGAGMVDTVIKLAKRGIGLRLYPRKARHHFCHTDLLIEVTRRVIEKPFPQFSTFIVADPYTVTNEELEGMIRGHLQRKPRTMPVPVPLVSGLLRNSFHSKNPKLDFATWGEIFGVLNLDTAYDPSDTFKVLEIDPSRYSLERTLKPVIQQAFIQ
ncbi:MAG TPA: NAD-dependent epimerase/dehydratase family protein [Terriglobales bacterium]|jgi:nucleoside-diphosphate-sugar epimerase|nr:NAD-dependent epimerase/dehydratase family protein [Terriglobales bacterium]